MTLQTFLSTHEDHELVDFHLRSFKVEGTQCLTIRGTGNVGIVPQSFSVVGNVLTEIATPTDID